MAEASLHSLEENLGYTFRDAGLLRLALTHPSVAHNKSKGRPLNTNQRLEFLGDAVLQLVLTRELYLRYPQLDEGPLTKARAKLVNARTLAEHARRLGLGRHLVLSKGEELHGGRERQSALADTFEAMLGALFLDGGLETASAFIQRDFSEVLAAAMGAPAVDNPKGELQELLQSASLEAPRYEILSITGPDHDRVFECTVHHLGVELARGQGKSKKTAEAEAALRALQKLGPARPVSAEGPARPDKPPSSALPEPGPVPAPAPVRKKRKARS